MHPPPISGTWGPWRLRIVTCHLSERAGWLGGGRVGARPGGEGAVCGCQDDPSLLGVPHSIENSLEVAAPSYSTDFRARNPGLPRGLWISLHLQAPVFYCVRYYRTYNGQNFTASRSSAKQTLAQVT